MSKKDPGKVIRSLDEIARKMAALRAGALTADEAFAKAEKQAKAFIEMFPLPIDKLLDKDLHDIDEIEKRIREVQASDFGGPKPSDIQGTQAQNIPAQTLADIQAIAAAMSRGMPPEQGPENANLQPGEWRSRGGVSIAGGRPGPAWGELQSPQDILRSRGIQGPANLKEGNDFADALEATVKRFEAGFPNSYFTAVVLAMEIPYLRIGARTVPEAKLYIQSFAPFFLPGFQRALIDPGLSQLERSLTNEAIRILQTGQVSTSASGYGGTPRTIGAPAPAEQPPAHVTAGITGRSGAPSGEPGIGLGAAAAGSTAGLGATITGAVTSATAGLSASLTSLTTTVHSEFAALRVDVRDPARQQAVLDRLREIHQRLDPNHFFDPLIDGQLRPMRREIGEIHQYAALGSTQTRELSMALERFQLSGNLSATV